MGKIIFIEGNPGSGKTTFSRRLKDVLQEAGYTVNQYQEGDLHPIDLAWCAILSKNQYEDILFRYPELKCDIKQHTKHVHNRYIFAYTKVDHTVASKAFYTDMATYEIFREKSINTFFNMHLKLWQTFSEELNPDVIYIFECVYLQNHINELILKYNLTENEQITYFKKLMAPLLPYQPLLFFIEQKSVKNAIERVSQARRSPDKTKFNDWIDDVVMYISNMPYAKTLNYTDYDGIIRYFEDRQTRSKKILQALKIDAHILSLNADYNAVFNQMKQRTLNTLK